MKRYSGIIGLFLLSMNLFAYDRAELVEKCKNIGSYTKYISFVCEGDNNRAEPNIVCFKSYGPFSTENQFTIHIMNETTENTESIQFVPTGKFKPENGRLYTSYKEEATWNHHPSFKFSKINMNLISKDDSIYTGSLKYKRHDAYPPVVKVNLNHLTCYKNDQNE